MIHQFRNLANSNFTKIILILTAVGFAFFGIGDVITSMNDLVVVQFSKLNNIHLSEVQRARKSLINQLQKTSDINLTQELLDEIDNLAINTLIKDRFYKGWIEDSGVLVGDKTIAAYIKTIPQFHDANHQFSLHLFQNFLSSLESDQEFYNNLKADIAKNLLDQAVLESVLMPKMLEHIILGYLSTTKSAQYVELFLYDRANLPKIQPKEEELKEFYNQDPQIFKLDEKRSVKYFIFENLEYKKDQDPSQDSIKNFMLKIKDLEDTVASGANLDEIAKKYNNISVKNFSGTSEDFEKNKDFANYASQIFEMNEAEVSYPLDIEDGKKVILCEIASIKEGVIPSFEDARNDVLQVFLDHTYSEMNLKKLAQFKEELKSSLSEQKSLSSKDNNFSAIAKKYGFIPKNVSFVLGKLEYNGLPQEVVVSAVNSDPRSVSEVIELDDRAYVIHVTNDFVDKKMEESFRKNHLSNIRNQFSNSVLEEVLAYYYFQNSPIIKKELLTRPTD